MSKPVIIVTGANGQLGASIKDVAKHFSDFTFHFFSRIEMPLEKPEITDRIFASLQPTFCINCAAYTAVDLAETNQKDAIDINATAVGGLASICRKYTTRFIHISTDYVFSGEGETPYEEDAPINPVNLYGASKAKGEELALLNDPQSIIIRTSWVYSKHGKNFVKTMLHLMTTRPEINVISDQTGSPTYAGDLANAILQMIRQGADTPGVYHYSNKGHLTWFDFAVAIREIAGKKCTIHPIPTSDYPTPAKRPRYSVMSTKKIENTYGIPIPGWRNSLEICLKELTEN